MDITYTIVYIVKKENLTADIYSIMKDSERKINRQSGYLDMYKDE